MKLTHICLGRAMLRWVENISNMRKVKIEKDRREKMLRRILSILKNRLGRIAITGWWAKVVERKESVNKACKAISRWRNQSLGNAIMTWIEKTDELKKVRKEKDRCCTILRRFTKILRNRLAHISFTSWLANVIQKHDLIRKARRVVARLTGYCAARAFSTWHLETKYWIQRTAVMTTVISQMNCTRVWGSLEGWMKEGARIQRAPSINWLHSTTVPKGSNWLQYSISLTQSPRGLQVSNAPDFMGNARRIKQSNTEKNFSLMAPSQPQVCLQRTRLIQQKFCAAMRLLFLTPAFSEWIEIASKQRKDMHKKRRAVMRIILLKAARCLDEWRSFTSEIKRRRIMMRRLITGMRQRTVWMALGAWRENTIDLRAGILRSQRLDKIKYKTLARIRNKVCAFAFGAWTNSIVTKKHVRCKAHRVVMRWILGSVVRSLDHWKFIAFEGARVRGIQRRIILRMQDEQ